MAFISVKSSSLPRLVFPAVVVSFDQAPLFVSSSKKTTSKTKALGKDAKGFCILSPADVGLRTHCAGVFCSFTTLASQVLQSSEMPFFSHTSFTVPLETPSRFLMC